MEEKKRIVIETDVLVVGGGTAGCFAAIEARKHGSKVVVVDKSCAGKAGPSVFNPGFLVFFKEDWNVSYDEAFKYFLKNGEYANDRAWLEIMLRESYQAVCDVREYGVQLVSSDEECREKFVNGFGRGTPKAQKDSGFYYMAQTGMPYRRMTPVLRKHAESLGAEFYDRIMVNELLKKDGRVVGAVGFSYDSGDAYIFNAKAVVMSGGKNSFRPNGMPVFNCTNDSCAMSFRAGAEVAGMEFPDTHNAAALHMLDDGSGKGVAFEGAPYADAEGHPAAFGMISPYYAAYWRFCNGDGNVIRTHMDMGIPYEVHQGGAPIQWDLHKATRKDYDSFIAYAEDRNEPVPLIVDPDNMKNVTMYGGGASGGYIEQQCGIGVEGTDCSTTLPGLYCAGDAAATMCWGISVSTNYGMMPSIVTGKHAGVGASEYASNHELEAASEEEIQRALDRIYLPFRSKGFSTSWVIQQLQNIMTPYYVQFVKSEDRLQSALTMIMFYQKHFLNKLIIHDWHELRIAHETANMLLGAEMILRSSLERRETRGGHYREDYPMRDDTNYFAYLRLKNVDGKMTVVKKELPREWLPSKDLPYEQRYMSRYWSDPSKNMIKEDN